MLRLMVACECLLEILYHDLKTSNLCSVSTFRGVRIWAKKTDVCVPELIVLS